MIKLTPNNTPHFTSVFITKVDFVFGDGDAYETVEIKHNNIIDLENALTIIDKYIDEEFEDTIPDELKQVINIPHDPNSGMYPVIDNVNDTIYYDENGVNYLMKHEII